MAGTIVRLADVATLTFLADVKPIDDMAMQTAHHDEGSKR